MQKLFGITPHSFMDRNCWHYRIFLMNMKVMFAMKEKEEFSNLILLNGRL